MKFLYQHKALAFFLIFAYLLSACTGVPAASGTSQPGGGDKLQEVVFTGTVDAMGGGEWTISGQAVTVDGSTSVDANIVVGSNVKVEATVDQGGVVTAVSIEVAGADDANANANTNDDNANANSNDNANSNANDNSSTGVESEISGTVEAIATDSITIDGVQYQITADTEFKDAIAVGDQVKAHVLTGADGSQTIREIEKVAGTVIGDDNSNSNTNVNSNDDDHGGNSNGNDDNDNGNDDNGNDSNNNG